MNIEGEPGGPETHDGDNYQFDNARLEQAFIAQNLEFDVMR